MSHCSDCGRNLSECGGGDCKTCKGVCEPEETQLAHSIDSFHIRRLEARIEARKTESNLILARMAEYAENEEWDLVRGLCYEAASCFESLRDDTNRLADLS